MRQNEVMPTELKVLSNHIYELQKGVRQMVLFTCPKQYEECARKRLCSQNMDYVLQPAGKNNLNFYIGRKECRPLNELSPEEDFILGAMLGYDLCAQCERYCERKNKCNCKKKCSKCNN